MLICKEPLNHWCIQLLYVVWAVIYNFMHSLRCETPAGVSTQLACLEMSHRKNKTNAHWYVPRMKMLFSFIRAELNFVPQFPTLPLFLASKALLNSPRTLSQQTGFRVYFPCKSRTSQCFTSLGLINEAIVSWNFPLGKYISESQSGRHDFLGACVGEGASSLFLINPEIQSQIAMLKIILWSWSLTSRLWNFSWLSGKPASGSDTFHDTAVFCFLLQRKS